MSATLSAPSRAEVISFFNNSTYVDSAQEGAALRATLTGLGHTVNEFTGIAAADFAAATLGVPLLVFPEMEIRDLNQDLTPAARAVLTAFVAGGGCIIQANYYSGNSSLPNALFGYSLAQLGNIGSTSLDAAAAAGTPFEGGPAVAPGSDAVEGVSGASLPAGALNLYHTGNTTSVFAATFGAGEYVYLGFDWFELPTPAVWTDVTGRAVALCVPSQPCPTPPEPSNPDPANEATGVPVDTILAWEVGGGEPGGLIEGFEDGDISEYTFVDPSGDHIVSAASAHDGEFGLEAVVLGPAEWIWRDDTIVHVQQGDTISYWAQVRSDAFLGRNYCGFGASPGGTYSIVMAHNSGTLNIQLNVGFGFLDLVSSGQSWQADKWYRMEVQWGVGGMITGRLFDSDGTTLLNTIAAQDNTFTMGGIAFRGFSHTYQDTVVRTSSPGVQQVALSQGVHRTPPPRDVADAIGWDDENQSWIFPDGPRQTIGAAPAISPSVTYGAATARTSGLASGSSLPPGLPSGGSCLVVNGDFEAGTLSGWTAVDSGSGNWVINDGSFDPLSGDSPLPPCAGDFTALTDQIGPGVHTLYQDVTLPSGASTLHWIDQIRNHAGEFSNPNQQFRVQILDPSTDAVLATLFQTNPGDMLIQPCTARSADISQFAGQTVRVAFTEADNIFFFNLHLDGVCIEAGLPCVVTHDVFLGTGPANLDLLCEGLTKPACDPGGLQPSTTYYWQVVSRVDSEFTEGPIWSFTTESDFTYQPIVLLQPSSFDRGELPAAVDECIAKGNSFVVELWATDSGNVNTGIVCAFADLVYLSDVSFLEVEPSALFSLFASGSDAGGVVDEVGGCGIPHDGVGVDEWARVAIVRFLADECVDPTSFSLEPATSESSAFARGTVETSNIQYGGADTCIEEGCVYDLDGNGFVDNVDFDLFSECWFCADADPCWFGDPCQPKDFDCSSQVAGGDLGWFSGAYLLSCDDLTASELPPCRRCSKLPVWPGSPESLRFTWSTAGSGLPAEPGSEWTDVASGGRFSIHLWVHDTAEESHGLSSAYVDLLFDPSQISVEGVSPAVGFDLLNMAEVSPGDVHRLGGATLQQERATDGWTLLATVRARALVDLHARPDLKVLPLVDGIGRVGLGEVRAEEITVIGP